MDNEGIQINKYISSTGYCSRREADKLIEQFRVMVNDDYATSTTKVYPGDTIIVDDEILKKSKKPPVYIAFNKPVGITTTTDLTDRSNIIAYINYPKRIFPIGRLDKDSEGLILLTNDGDIVNKILRAGNQHDKEYIVYVNKALTPDFGKKMANGIPVDGTITLPCKVKQEGGKRFKITLRQGLNRQIRKMCEYLGYQVVSLQRIRIMHIQLDKLEPGKWRYLSQPEIQQLEQLLQHSSKT
jgi:23S rRNA pseudouridine2604 synthase